MSAGSKEHLSRVLFLKGGMKVEVVIVGAGSIGLLIGSYLGRFDCNITFLVRREEQAESIREKGIQYIGENGIRETIHANACTQIENVPEGAHWIVAVKFNGVASVLERLKSEKLDPPLLFVQNGIGHLEMIANTELSNLFVATVEHGAARLNDYTVSHNGVGLTKVACFRGVPTTFNFLKQLQTHTFPIEFSEGAQDILLRKVLINCAINPLTAILQVNNGHLIENDFAHALLSQLYEELLSAFPEMQKELPKSAIEDVCKRTARNESSMLKDRKSGRPMEIETIVSAVIALAAQRGKPLPFLQTMEKMLRVMDGGEPY